MSGRDEKATDGASCVLLPAATVIEAQFMYISRFPILLYHVQAKRASPAGASLGTVKSNDWPLVRGQLPMKEVITLKVAPLS